MTKETELLQKLCSAADELAQYASYAEIVGGIHHNRSAIRNNCDIVFSINQEIREYFEEKDECFA
jgi:hypothetical protein